jgi:hypothetical protein
MVILKSVEQKAYCTSNPVLYLPEEAQTPLDVFSHFL